MKLLLHQDFNVINCARDIEMPAHHLSYFIKQQFGLNFTSDKNNLRLEYAKKLIEEGFLDTNIMEASAWECNFANRNSFSKAFKMQRNAFQVITC
jgi:AraC-like DNA-binding protein